MIVMYAMGSNVFAVKTCALYLNYSSLKIQKIILNVKTFFPII